MLTKQQILEALRKWINQRPGLEFANYGDRKSYRQELRSITRDRADALQLMQAVSWCDSITAENMIDSFRAFSGRLQVREVVPASVDGGPYAELSYCTGQYWPSEYRKAACAVLAQALWGAAQADMPAPDPNKKITKTFGTFANEHESIDGLTPGDWMRRYFRREFGRGIESRWFN